ncbi:hypothetical protein QZH41_002470, partial [Actinostola sp. cb2023]
RGRLRNLAIALLTNHGLAHPKTQRHSPNITAPRGPKLERPKVDIGISVEEWNIFKRRWEVFRAGSGIDDSSEPSQLFQCAGTSLGITFSRRTPTQQLNLSAPTHGRHTFPWQLSRLLPASSAPNFCGFTKSVTSQSEHSRPKVRGKAETCSFATKCPCGLSANYTDHAIRDVIVNGLYDNDIRREVLAS